MLGFLLHGILSATRLADYQEIIVVTDRIPMEKKRKAIEGAIKETLARMLPREARYRLLHHESKSSFDLQIVDYVNWAIYRKWERGELRSYNLIRPAVRQEIELLPRLAWLLSLVKGSGLLP